MAEKKTFGADMRISGFGVFTDGVDTPDAMRKIKFERLETDHFEGVLDDLDIRADELSIDTLQTSLGRGQTTAESVDLGSLEARSHDGNIEFSSHRIGCPSGVLFTRGEELFAPHASMADAHIVIHDMAALFDRTPSNTDDPPEPEGENSTQPGEGEENDAGDEHRAENQAGNEATEAAPGSADQRDPMDWRFLDALQGRLHLDLVLDMTLPWVGRRKATHYFRIPIEDGTINYEKLEDDVHWLESTFLTIEQIGNQLVLARDLPLVPFSGKALLVWPLEEEDIPIAAYRRVHLRNLLRPQVPSRANRKKSDTEAGKDKGKSRLTLHTLTLENIKLSLHTKTAVQITLPDGASLQLGGDEQPGLVNLEMTGALHYQAGETSDPTALSGDADLIDVTIKDLRLGSSVVSADRLHVSAIDKIEIGFDGLRPRRLELWASRIAATNLRIHLAQR